MEAFNLEHSCGCLEYRDETYTIDVYGDNINIAKCHLHMIEQIERKIEELRRQIKFLRLNRNPWIDEKFDQEIKTCKTELALQRKIKKYALKE